MPTMKFHGRLRRYPADALESIRQRAKRESPGDDELAAVSAVLAAGGAVVVRDARPALEARRQSGDDPTVEVAGIRVLADGDDPALARNRRVAVVSDAG